MDLRVGDKVVLRLHLRSKDLLWILRRDSHVVRCLLWFGSKGVVVVNERGWAMEIDKEGVCLLSNQLDSQTYHQVPVD